MSTKKLLLVSACALAICSDALSQTQPTSESAAPHYPPQQVATFVRLREKIEGAETIHVAFLGGSITAGVSTSPKVGTDEFGPYDFSWYENDVHGYRTRVLAGLQERFGVFVGQFLGVDASLGGSGSVMGAYRLEQNVLAGDPDLVFVEFVVNDIGKADLDPTEEGSIPRALQSIVTQLREHDPDVAIFGVHSTVRDEADSPPTDLQRQAAHSRRQHRRFLTTLEEPIPFFDAQRAYSEEPLPDGILGPFFRGPAANNQKHPAPDGHALTALGCLDELEGLLYGPGFRFPRMAPYPMPVEPYPRSPRIVSAAELLASSVSTGFELREAESGEPIFEDTEALYATAPSASLRFDFEGAAVGLWCQFRYAGNYVLRARVEAFLDGQPLGTFAYPLEPGATFLNKFTPLASELGPGPHSLLLQFLDDQLRDFRFALHGVVVDGQ